MRAKVILGVIWEGCSIGCRMSAGTFVIAADRTRQEKNLFGQPDTKNHRNVICAGVQYTLPLLFTLDGRVDMKGNLRLQLGREDIAVTSRLRFSLMANTDKEYMAGFRYILTKYIGLSTHYDSDMGFGAGVTVNY